MSDKQNDKKKKVDTEDSEKVSEHNYHPDDENGNSQLEEGLSETHKQVEGDYSDGTSDRDKDKKSGKTK